MKLFDEEGFFWVPEQYARVRVPKEAKQPRVLPPIPPTGWKPPTNFPDLSTARAISIDTETCDPDLLTHGPGAYRDGFLVGVSVATDDFAAYFPLAHTIGENVERTPVLAWLREQLSRPRQPKVGANIMYDLEYLAAADVPVVGPLYDVLFADPLLYEYETSYSLDAVAARRLNEHKETSLLYAWCADAYGGKPDSTQRANIWRAPSSLVGPYAEQDARLPLRILRAQWPLLRAMEQTSIFEMECRLIPLLLQMRRRGVLLNLARCQEVDDELSQKIDTAQKEVGLNVHAAAEIQRLCEAENIAYPRTAKGNASFTKAWLKEQTHPKLARVVELRNLYKMRDTFIRGSLLSKHVGGRVHCQLHPLRSDEYGTVSGRFSSSTPNLQQIPARHEYWGPRIRSCFVPDAEHVWMKDDLSQIEFRLGVHYGVGSGIERVRAAYNEDPRTNFYKLATALTSLPYAESKALSLGTLYGMGLPKFASMIGKSVGEAEQIFATYNERLPFMRATYAHFARLATERATTSAAGGWVRTIGGRLCHLLPGFEHKALNRLLQGSCADWVKRAMLDSFEAGVFDVLLLYLTVHDELDSGVPATPEGAEAAAELQRRLTSAYDLRVPVLATRSQGASWGELA